MNASSVLLARRREAICNVFSLLILTSLILASELQQSEINDLDIGWQNLNPLSHPNARQVRASGENLNNSLSR